jgi:hypothetical protein
MPEPKKLAGLSVEWERILPQMLRWQRGFTVRGAASFSNKPEGCVLVVTDRPATPQTPGRTLDVINDDDYDDKRFEKPPFINLPGDNGTSNVLVWEDVTLTDDDGNDHDGVNLRIPTPAVATNRAQVPFWDGASWSIQRPTFGE